MRLLDIFLGPRRPAEAVTAELEQEFKDIPHIVLHPAMFRETAEEAQQPIASLSRKVIEISRVPDVAKAKGESIKATLVYKPESGSPIVIGLEQIQEDKGAEIEPGGPLRLSIPENSQGKVFAAAGIAVVYAKGDGLHKWVFDMNVPWGVSDELRR